MSERKTMTQEAVDQGTRESVSDADRVASRLRQAIVAGDFAPRQRLVETDLIEMFDASRGAVRAALATLTVEGLVEKIRNRGARVRAVDLDEALEIVEVRAALESMCAARAAERVDDAGMARLRDLGEVMRGAVDSGDGEAYSQANRDLHQAVMDISGSKVAPDIVQRLRAQNVRYRIQLSMQPHRPATSLPEHLEIVEAVCAKDPERAANAMRAHLESVFSATKEYFGNRK
ncbi:GntR family transcriptional regulator [Nocardiopsis sp. NPDC006832]|uniref:GntR family transcriptional regulator n=1 Tax=Nocardiopsis sp. NPDC006832 TaxID=3157188 RepID=UPI00340D3ECD